MRPTGRVFRVRRHHHPTLHVEHRPLTHPHAKDLNKRMGACLGLCHPPYAPPPAPAHTNTQSASYGTHFSCSTPPPPHPSRRTPKTCPCGHVLGVHCPLSHLNT